MKLVNSSSIAGYKVVKTLGLVSGNTVQSKHVGRDFMASLKTLIGGEIAGYTEMLVEARQKAQGRMVEHAKSLGANAIMNVRFTSCSVAQGMTELLAYGTAVEVEEI